MHGLSKRDEKFISYAITQAHESKLKMRHGCAVTINGKLVTTACNTERCSFKHKKNICSCHAEVGALNKLNKKLHLDRHTRDRKLRSCSRPSCKVKHRVLRKN